MEDELEYFKRLSGILEETGFEWLLTQVRNEIAEGHAVKKEVNAPSMDSKIDPVTRIVRQPQRRRSSLVTTEPLTSRQQLFVLIEAIEAAVIVRAELEESVFRMNKDMNEISFMQDESDKDLATGEHKPHSLTRGNLENSVTVKKSIRNNLEELRGLLDGSA